MKWKLVDINNLVVYRIICGNFLNLIDMVLLFKDIIDMFFIYLIVFFLLFVDEYILYGKFNLYIKLYWKKLELYNVYYEMWCFRRVWKLEGLFRDK